MSQKNHNKLLTDFHRLLGTQEFKTLEELESFMNKIAVEPIPEFPEEALTLKERAQDLVFQAYDVSLSKGRQKIEIALKLDPDCIEAHEYLGNHEQSPSRALSHYEKGIAIGRRLFFGDFLKKGMGHFWLIHETRPFMRCLSGKAQCLYASGRKKECTEVLEEMLILNPNDNQGVRDLFLIYLIELNEDEKFRTYAKKYKADFLAFPLYTRALFSFKTEGPTEKSRKLLAKAMKANPYIPAMLLQKVPPGDQPGYYGVGDENEAVYFVSVAHPIWRKVEGAMKWLRGFMK